MRAKDRGKNFLKSSVTLPATMPKIIIAKKIFYRKNKLILVLQIWKGAHFFDEKMM
jgi:ABC-type spermidine/putrescine transport system permease subunit II